MKRILIYKIVVPNGEYDLWNRVDTNRIIDTVDTGYGGQCPNWGNRVWLQGIVSGVHSSENHCELYSENMTPEYINANFDLIILPMANFFGVENISRMKEFTARFANIKVPTYVIACGAQAKSYDELNDLIAAIREPASAFIKAIYRTGGEFALRGYFTKEFFDRLGFSTAVVTGCPSMFQNGRHFSIEYQPVSEEEFRPVLNGEMGGVAKHLRKYPNSGYIDQERFFDLLYRPQRWDDPRHLASLVRKYGYDPVYYAAKGTIMQFPDCIDWHNYLIDMGFHFSFGSRIHGNIMPILSGIPSTVWAIDSRTQEMAEFFDIPYVTDIREVNDLYDLYLRADYAKFNRTYAKRFSAFEEFLKAHGIIESFHDDNIFWNQDSSDRTYPDFSHPDAAKSLEQYEYLFKLNWYSHRLVKKAQRVFSSNTGSKA